MTGAAALADAAPQRLALTEDMHGAPIPDRDALEA
jgi:hypothetical protein